MPERSLDDWLTLLETRHPVEIELGLERITPVARRLRLDPLADRVVVVAGTNGKGSCVRILENLALASGLRVAAYTSPHIIDFNERLRLQGRDVDSAELCGAFEAVEGARGETPLTYFETATLAAMVIIRARHINLAVLEVGLGGRLDAVNIVDADVAAITAIDLDHTQWLGETRDAIAVEKAGIVRRDRPVVCSDTAPPAALREALARAGARPLFINGNFGGELRGGQLTAWLEDGAGCHLQLDPLPPPRLPLASALAALEIALLLDILPGRDLIGRVLAESALPGRFQERVVDGIRVVLDVAHNPAAAAYLAKCLEAAGCSGRVLCVAAMMADKPAEAFIDALGARVDEWFAGDLAANRRALPAAALAKHLDSRGFPVRVQPTVETAFEEALASAENHDMIVVCGSFYTVSAVAKHLGGGGE